ncbi:MAG TPA: pseudouridine synthase [Terracidiphilus sp.]|nr:pseudouridine synthase [Terracidiphilus sp.]
MSDETERELVPEAEGPEQDIASDAAELLSEEAGGANRPESSPGTDADAAVNVEAEADETAPRPAPKLERLQKILAQAGVASRRHAEELITGGHVQVNGQTVTVLGTKADAAHDHIRVDGKLLHGAERLRYFMLNKPRGHVTTVSDPEGRPTVMEFFSKMGERLYPVGRLDYLSEGLLLVTNDGELANALTKASSGVEKTYLVKVAGQPTEDELDVLRGGVTIDRGKPGEGKVQTAAARVRQVRQGDNPWFEVVLIEGRNRELRKMFEEIGHFVEKIRRVGYGPLVLDIEPGKVRELDATEVEALRQTAAGKLKVRKPRVKDARLRKAMDAQLPTLPPKPSRKPFVKPPQAEPESAGEARAFKPREFRPREAKPGKFGAGDFRPQKAFGADKRVGANKPFRAAPGGPAAGRPAARPATGPARFGTGRPSARPPFNPDRPAARPAFRSDRPAAPPAWKKDDRPSRPPARDSRTLAGRNFGSKPGGARPAWNKPSGDRPAYKRPAPNPDELPGPPADFVRKPSRLRIEAADADSPRTSRTSRTGPPRPRPAFDRPKPAFDRPRPARAQSDRPKFERSSGPARLRFDRPTLNRPRPDRAESDRPASDRPRFDRPRSEQAGRGFSSGAGRSSRFGSSGSGRTGAGPSAGRPARSGGLARPFTTSSGKPRPGGARPNNKHGKPGGKPGSKPFGKGPGKPAFGSKPKAGGPKPGGAKSGGFKKPGGFKSGPKPGSGSGFKGKPKPSGRPPKRG